MESLASAFSSGAGESLAGSTFESGALAGSEAAAGEAAAAGAGEAALPVGAAGAPTAAELPGLNAMGATYYPGAGESLAGGTFESGAGLTGVEGGTVAEPGLTDTIMSAYNTAQPYLSTAQKIMNAANLVKQGVSGAGTPAGPQAAGAPSMAPLTTTDPTGADPRSRESRDEYERQQQAYWAQLMAGTGNISPGGDLPPGVQDMIRRQSSLYYA
jgi:hypothetical protein